MQDDNTVVIEAWNTVLFDKFVRFKHLLVDGLSSHSDAFFAKTEYPLEAHCSTVGTVWSGFGY